VEQASAGGTKVGQLMLDKPADVQSAGMGNTFNYERSKSGGRGEISTTCGFSSAVERKAGSANEEVVSLSLTCYGSLFAACPSAVSRSWRRTLPFSSK
jgi:hypothetical protein